MIYFAGWNVQVGVPVPNGANSRINLGHIANYCYGAWPRSDYMDQLSTSSLHCTECGERIDEAGYVPAVAGTNHYEPRTDAAVCDACGFNEIGMMGCAPELDDVVDPTPDDVLLYVRAVDDGYDVVSEKE